MSEPYLILHKVRGEPAFDIAECIGEDSDGELWIIPTSGHRAYPYWSTPLQVENINAANALEVLPQCPDGWPDHYTVTEDKGGYGHKEYRKAAVSDLLNRLGLNRKPSLIRRIPK